MVLNLLCLLLKNYNISYSNLTTDIDNVLKLFKIRISSN
jgi:hypothetical protein